MQSGRHLGTCIGTLLYAATPKSAILLFPVDIYLTLLLCLFPFLWSTHSNSSYTKPPVAWVTTLRHSCHLKGSHWCDVPSPCQYNIASEHRTISSLGMYVYFLQVKVSHWCDVPSPCQCNIASERQTISTWGMYVNFLQVKGSHWCDVPSTWQYNIASERRNISSLGMYIYFFQV